MMPHITWRAGINLQPLNPLDPADAAWLRALVWADHTARARLLDSALRAVALRPPHSGPRRRRHGAAARSHCGRTAGAVLCIMHTAFLAHLTSSDRARFERQVAALSANRPVYCVSAETRASSTEPRLRLARCENKTLTGSWPLAL